VLKFDRKLAGRAWPLTLCVLARVAASGEPAADVQVPFPRFAPRASATIVYCQPTLENTLTGRDLARNAKKSEPAHIESQIYEAGRPIDSKSGVDQSLKLTFQSPQLLVALKAIKGIGQAGADGYMRPNPYQVLNDSPGNFVAISTAQVNRVGSLDIVSMDRWTGTMIYTWTYASLPDMGHPFTGARFYVCDENTR
jgi:hypothetical protein